MTRSIAFAAALTLAAIAGAAHAEDRSIVRVNVSGYNLSKPADAQKVYGQLQQAVRSACNNMQHEVFASDEAERMDQCYSFTLDKIVAQSKAPLLAALNGQKVPAVQLAAK